MVSGYSRGWLNCKETPWSYRFRGFQLLQHFLTLQHWRFQQKKAAIVHAKQLAKLIGSGAGWMVFGSVFNI